MKDIKERVIEAIKKIPRGKTKTYKDIAQEVGCSPRYVGYVCSLNRDYENVPCHRVVGSDGSLGGYNRGVKLKEKLLKEEGVKIKNGRILR